MSYLQSQYLPFPSSSCQCYRVHLTPSGPTVYYNSTQVAGIPSSTSLTALKKNGMPNLPVLVVHSQMLFVNITAGMPGRLLLALINGKFVPFVPITFISLLTSCQIFRRLLISHPNCPNQGLTFQANR